MDPPVLACPSTEASRSVAPLIKRGVTMVVTVLLGVALFNLLGAPVELHGSPHVELRLYLGKAVFFDQEPIYAVFELSNNGIDTAWISPFGLTYPALTPVLSSGAGSPVARLASVSDYVTVRGWRGVPVAPGERLYAIGVLQDEWGAADSVAQGLFMRHLSPGSYDLSATFVSEVGSDVGRAIHAQPVRFSIRERTHSEETLYREVKQLTRMAWDRQERPRYLVALQAWVSERLLAKDVENPYLAFALHNGVQIAKAVGSWPDAASAARLASLRMAVIDAQRSMPAGAYAVDAGYADRPELVPPLAPALGQSLAGSVAAQREKEHRSKARPKQ